MKNYEPSLDGCYAGLNEPPDDMEHGWLKRGLESAVREQAAMNKFRLSEIALNIENCSACSLRAGRNKSVPGEGNPQAKVIVVGESPGRTENETGRPFVGRSGKLLDNMIKSIGLAREDVFISNICHCWPLNNRKPTPTEMNSCLHFLQSQIEIINPKVIVALGNTALEGLTGRGAVTSRCGKCESIGDIWLVPCFHPSALLRNPELKKPAWHAMQKVKELIET